MIGTRASPAASSALRIPATRPSIMSLGATMSTPARGVLHELVHRRVVDARQGGDLAAHPLAVDHEQRPHELRRGEVRLLHQPAQRGRAPQPAHPADRELSHRASNSSAPCAPSKSATARPAAAGSAGSTSADAGIWMAAPRAVARPSNLFLPPPPPPL